MGFLAGLIKVKPAFSQSNDFLAAYGPTADIDDNMRPIKVTHKLQKALSIEERALFSGGR